MIFPSWKHWPSDLLSCDASVDNVCWWTTWGDVESLALPPSPALKIPWRKIPFMASGQSCSCHLQLSAVLNIPLTSDPVVLCAPINKTPSSDDFCSFTGLQTNLWIIFNRDICVCRRFRHVPGQSVSFTAQMTTLKQNGLELLKLYLDIHPVIIFWTNSILWGDEVPGSPE